MKELLYFLVCILAFCIPLTPDAQNYLGNLSANKFAPNSLSNPYGAGNPYNPSSPSNSFGQNKFKNPYGNDTNSPKIYDSNGSFKGNLNTNKYDPNSVSNPYGRYGSKYSPDSINNPHGQYGSKYSPNSVNNPYGQGLKVYGR